VTGTLKIIVILIFAARGRNIREEVNKVSSL
jgi:hypothetical protein